MTSHYKKFTKLIAKWPLDTTKGERDLGKFIRDRVKVAFESKDKEQWGSEACARQYEALNRLASNHYRDKYKRTRHGSATGLSTSECNAILSADSLTYLREENKGFFKKIFHKD